MAPTKTEISHRPRTITMPARAAGMETISWSGVLAGFLVAASAVALLGALAGALARAAGMSFDMSTGAWTRAGIGGGIIATVVMLVAWLYGGYVAGRMAGRAGVLNGFLSFVVAVVVVGAVAAVVRTVSGTDQIVANLRSLGVPTGSGDLRTVGLATGIALAAAMLLGALLGGGLGTRFHRRMGQRLSDVLVEDTLIHGTGDPMIDHDRTVIAPTDVERPADADRTAVVHEEAPTTGTDRSDDGGRGDTEVIDLRHRGTPAADEHLDADATIETGHRVERYEPSTDRTRS